MCWGINEIKGFTSTDNEIKRKTRKVPLTAATSLPQLSSASTGRKGFTETRETKAASQAGSNPTEKPEEKEVQVVIQPTEVKKKETASQARKSKRESSSLLKAFAKAKPKMSREDTDSSVALSVRIGSCLENKTRADSFSPSRLNLVS